MMGISLSIAISVLITASAAGDLRDSSDKKILIVHADDVGMCHSVNEATIRAFKDGAVSSASIMVPCPWFLEIAEYCRENPDVDMGIHTTLTSEWKHYRWRPVSSIDKVPGLIDEEGYLWHSVEDVVKHATPEEVETEMRAQVQRAIDFGIKPTHIDTHMGTVYANHLYFAAYIKVAKEFGIPAMIVSPDSEIAKNRYGDGHVAETLLKTLKMITDGMPTLDELATGVSSAELEPRREEYKDLIRNLKPGVTQIIVHLGLDSQEMQGITSSWLARYNDFRIFSDPKMRQFIEDQGVELVGWREMSATR